MVKVKEDLTGRQFGRLIVICQAEDYIQPSNGKHRAQWLCECSCEEHNQVVVAANNLKSGKVNSCGCIRKELVTEFNQETKKKYNKYDLSGEFGIGWTSNTNEEFYFDIEDYDQIKDCCWNEHIKTNGYHVLETYDDKTNKVISMMHILGFKGYDHKNRNTLDNRKENLRPATQHENVMNKGLQKNNVSGVTGVGWIKKLQKWRARITYNEKEIYLGLFANKDDAIKARLEAEKEYFGEFAPQQHLFKQYNINQNGGNGNENFKRFIRKRKYE